MDDKFIGSIKQADSEICFFVCEQDERYYAKVFDSDVLKKSKNPNNAVLLLDKTDLNEIIYILSRALNGKGTTEWDFIINEIDNTSVHLRRIKTANKKFKYDLRKYLNSSVFTGWLKAGITVNSQHIPKALEFWKLSMKELDVLDKRSVNDIKARNSTEYSILDDIFSDFDL